MQLELKCNSHMVTGWRKKGAGWALPPPFSEDESATRNLLTGLNGADEMQILYCAVYLDVVVSSSPLAVCLKRQELKNRSLCKVHGRAGWARPKIGRLFTSLCNYGGRQ